MKMKLKVLVTVALAVFLLAPLAGWAATATATDTSTGIVYTLTYTSQGGTGNLTLTSFCSAENGCATNLDAFSVSGGSATASNPAYDNVSNTGQCADGFNSFITNAPDACLSAKSGPPPHFPQTFAITNATDIVFHAAAFENSTSCSIWAKFDFNGGGNLTNGVTNNSGGSNCGTPVPEPGSLALLGSGLVGLAGLLRRRLLG